MNLILCNLATSVAQQEFSKLGDMEIEPGYEADGDQL